MSLLKVAVASRDEENVDTHFGEARNYLVYEINTENGVVERKDNINIVIDNQDESLEDTTTRKCCDHKSTKARSGCPGHNDEKINAIAKQLSDCNYVFVKKIGPKPQKILLRYDINCLETDFSIDEAINRLAHYFNK